nr:hypothetical protein [uncultured archaeon]
MLAVDISLISARIRVNIDAARARGTCGISDSLH